MAECFSIQGGLVVESATLAELKRRQAAQGRSRLHESVSIVEPDWVGAYRDILDQFGQDWLWGVGGSITSRRHGTQWPFFRTEQELGFLRDASRMVVGTNPHAAGLVGGLCAYVIAEGMNVEPAPADGTNDAGDRRLCDAVGAVIEEFEDRTLFAELQQHVFNGSLIDGEYFLRLFDLGGHVEVRQILPELLRQPLGTTFERWSFGIETPEEDPEHTLSYWSSNFDATHGEQVPANQVVHWPAFIPGRWTRGVKRGIPLFAFVVKEMLESAAKSLRNTGEGVAIRQAIAYVQQWENASQATVSTYADGAADYAIQKPLNPGVTTPVTVARPGTVPNIPKGMSMIQPPTNPETASAGAVVDALLRSVVSIWNAPEWIASGNASNMGAYTSSLVAESPFVKRCKQAQAYYAARFKRVYDYVIRCAVNAGRLPRECLTRVKLNVTPISPETRDREKEAALNEKYVGMGVKSRQQVARELDIDFDVAFQENVEFQKLTQEAQARLQPAGAGGAPQGPPGDGSDGGSGPGAPPGGQPPPPTLPGAETGGDKAGADLSPFGDVAESQRLAESGFTGTKDDKLGRKMYYRDGKHVPAPSAKEKRDIEGQSGGKGDAASPGAPPAKRAAPGSQMPEAHKAKLRELGMVGTFPPADVPASEIKVADLSRGAEALKFEPLMSWNQRTASGRISRQYRYTQEFHDRNAAAKFERVQSIEPHVEKIGAALTAQLADTSLPPRQREAAAIAGVIRETGLRPTDGDESVKHGHFGISSLQARHAEIVGDEVHLDFIGKEGVRNRTVVRELANVAFLKEALGRSKGEEFLFREATSDDAGAALKEASAAAGGPADIKLKDLRTLKATRTARQVVAGYAGPPPPLSGDAKKDGKAIASAILKMSGEVAAVLNNTPTQARDNYIHPEVFKRWQSKLSAAG